jgi:hypothetical protein
LSTEERAAFGDALDSDARGIYQVVTTEGLQNSSPPHAEAQKLWADTFHFKTISIETYLQGRSAFQKLLHYQGSWHKVADCLAKSVMSPQRPEHFPFQIVEFKNLLLPGLEFKALAVPPEVSFFNHPISLISD